MFPITRKGAFESSGDRAQSEAPRLSIYLDTFYSPMALAQVVRARERFPEAESFISLVSRPTSTSYIARGLQWSCLINEICASAPLHSQG
jgi:hypothetical protein